ncbi:nucleotide sugar dehydrogenase [Candidatus Bathyarchaeota archaeon]|nr:nucleotide sugar dehydrogenase [Candidatus Bathyarchaeota archaeon]
MHGSEPVKIDLSSLSTPEGRSRYTVSVVGCGRMGLPHACLFADAGFKVIGVDKNPKILEALASGRSPFEEPRLEEKISRHVKEGRFTVTGDCAYAASKSDVIVLVVPTLVDDKLKPDYSYVEKACEELGIGLRRGSLFIVASTVGPGVTETLIKERLEKFSGLKAGRDFSLAYSPIRGMAGKALHDIENYVRVVGGIDDKSVKLACRFLDIITKAGTIPASSIKVAEAFKLFLNVQRDLNLALANELAMLCERLEIDYLEVRELANIDPYSHLLFPGLVGGHIPKDPYLLIEEAEGLGVDLKIAKAAREVNETIVGHSLQLLIDVLKECGKSLNGSNVAVLGVSYRADVKERRGSRAVTLIEELSRRGVKVKVYDPYFRSEDLSDLDCRVEGTLEKTVKGVDCVVVTVGHRRFKELNLEELKSLMAAKPALVDLARVVDPKKAWEAGFKFRGLGRPSR